MWYTDSGILVDKGFIFEAMDVIAKNHINKTITFEGEYKLICGRQSMQRNLFYTPFMHVRFELFVTGTHNYESASAQEDINLKRLLLLV